MRPNRDIHFTAALCTLLLHAVVLSLASAMPWAGQSVRQPVPAVEHVVVLQFLAPERLDMADERMVETFETAEPMSAAPGLSVLESPLTQHEPVTPTAHSSPAIQAAPPPPSAEEWAFAARYTHRNSKGYRYSWGQQVRSMMGTAVEGPDQGFVRFRVEIAPDGTLARLDTLWTTSAVAEQLARKAVQSMPPLPPTPTGNPLVFEKTISFTPFATDGPPSYKDDCLPDPPAFRNPFAWDGQSPQVMAESPKADKLDPRAMEECLRQLPADSIDAEMARDRRAMERWGWK